jgi:hypothetical protein
MFRREIFPSTDYAKEEAMSDQTLGGETKTETKTAKLIRIILCWVAFGLLVFTCVMAAIKKFG